MKNYNDVLQKIAQYQDILELGCGNNKLPGAFGIDIEGHRGVDLVADLNKPIALESSSYDVIISNQVLEHIQSLNELMNECHRILKPGGWFIATVPYFRSSWAVIDPTHVRFFSLGSMDYFTQGTLMHSMHPFVNPGFLSCDVHLNLLTQTGIVGRTLARLAKRFPNRFENSSLSFLFPFEDITFILRK